MKYKKTCPSKAVAHVCIDHREVGFQDGLFKDKVDGSLQPLLCVNCQLLHLLYELLKLLRGEFVEDTTEMLKQLLSLDLLRIVIRSLLLAEAAKGLPRRRPPCILSLFKLHATAVGQVAAQILGLFPLILLGAL